jgi:hypothetical protein
VYTPRGVTAIALAVLVAERRGGAGGQVAREADRGDVGAAVDEAVAGVRRGVDGAARAVAEDRREVPEPEQPGLSAGQRQEHVGAELREGARAAPHADLGELAAEERVGRVVREAEEERVLPVERGGGADAGRDLDAVDVQPLPADRRAEHVGDVVPATVREVQSGGEQELVAVDPRAEVAAAEEEVAVVAARAERAGDGREQPGLGVVGAQPQLVGQLAGRLADGELDVVVDPVEHGAAAASGQPLEADRRAGAPAGADQPQGQLVDAGDRVGALVGARVDQLHGVAGLEAVVHRGHAQAAVGRACVSGDRSAGDQRFVGRDHRELAERGGGGRDVERVLVDADDVGVDRVDARAAGQLDRLARGELGRRGRADQHRVALARGEAGDHAVGRRGRRAEGLDLVERAQREQQRPRGPAHDLLAAGRLVEPGQRAVGRDAEAQREGLAGDGARGDHHPHRLAEELRAGVGDALALDVVAGGGEAVGRVQRDVEAERPLDDAGDPARRRVEDRRVLHREQAVVAGAQAGDHERARGGGDDVPVRLALLAGRQQHGGEAAVGDAVDQAQLAARLEELAAVDVAEVERVARQPCGPVGRALARLVALAAAPVADLQLAREAVGQPVEHEPVDQQRAGPRLAKYVQVPGARDQLDRGDRGELRGPPARAHDESLRVGLRGVLGAFAGDDRLVVGLVGQRERTPVLPADPLLGRLVDRPRDRRPLPDPRAARRGRHGRGVHRGARQAAQAGRAQDDQDRVRGQQPGGGAVRPRGAGDRADRPPARRQRDRLRPAARGRDVPGDPADPRREPERADRARRRCRGSRSACSAARSPTLWRPRTRSASSTATSSPRTSCSSSAATPSCTRGSSTSASPACRRRWTGCSPGRASR